MAKVTLMRTRRLMALGLGAVVIAVLEAAPAMALAGGEAWVVRYAGLAGGVDRANSMTVSPDGSTVYVSGYSRGETTGNDYATIAYNATTGAQKWVATYNGTGLSRSDDEATSVQLSPDGTRVFVTGFSQGAGSGYDYATVAYNAATGTELWVARYNGPGNSADHALSLAVSSDGTRVYVTGASRNEDLYDDYATVAYDAATGDELWAARYRGGEVAARAVRVSPDGARVYVTGTGGTFCYDALTGAELWVALSARTYGAIAISPDGQRVYLQGSMGVGAYDAVTGTRLWRNGYPGFDSSLALSSGSTQLFVGGSIESPTTGYDYVTVVYDAGTGAKLWVRQYNGPASRFDFVSSVGLSPDDAQVYITGRSQGSSYSYDYATVAYDALTGNRLWIARLTNVAGSGAGGASALGVSPGGGRVYVTGGSHGDIATVAYKTT